MPYFLFEGGEVSVYSIPIVMQKSICYSDTYLFIDLNFKQNSSLWVKVRERSKLPLQVSKPKLY